MTEKKTAQEQGVALFLGAGLDRADDLGPPRGEMNPSRVGPARQGFGDRVGTAGSGLQPEKPVGPAQPGAVGYAEDSQPGRLRHPAVFFFSSRRRHTSFDCDWSSDVCSSD